MNNKDMEETIKIIKEAAANKSVPHKETGYNDIILKILTPEEYSKKVNEFYAARDINGFLEFQKTNNILYEDPIPEQHKEILKDIEIADMPDNTNFI